MLPVCILVATRNRPKNLSALLERLSEVRSEFAQVVIVDSSDADKLEEVASSLAKFEKLLGPIEFIHTEERSLTRQKNLGLPLCLKYQAFQVLDDDVLPPKGFISKSFELLQRQNADGVSGITQEVPDSLPRRSLFEAAFGLRSSSPGNVSPAGIGTPVDPSWQGPIRVEWLIGCSMWRSATVVNTYEESLDGSSLYEDVIFSLGNKRVGGLWVEPSLVLHHDASIEERPESRTYWYRFAHNRVFILRLTSKAPRWQLSRGNAGALLQILFGKEQSKRDSLQGLFEGWAAALKLKD